MISARGHASRSLLNREFPHRVVVPADNIRGRVIEEVGAFHHNRGLPVKYHSLRLDDQWYSAYCFADRGDGTAVSDSVRRRAGQYSVICQTMSDLRLSSPRQRFRLARPFFAR
jgi:hypothetical protein